MGGGRSAAEAQRRNNLTNEIVTVHIEYQETNQTFTGDPEQVWKSINKFFIEMIPIFQIIKNVLLTIDLENLIEDVKNLIALTPEGPVLLVSKQKLTDSETLSLNLIAAFIGNKLGQSKDAQSKEELQIVLGKSAKITSTRLGELMRQRLATKTEEGNYRITTLGIKRFQEETLPEIREKLQRKKILSFKPFKD